YAFGGGWKLAVACDFRIMGGGKSGLTAVSLGLIPGAGGMQSLTKIIGRAKAMELILLSKRLDGEEAEAVGMIHRHVEPEKLEEEADDFAEQIAEGVIHAMGLAKRAINAAEGSLVEGMNVEAHAFADTFNTEEPG